MTAKLSMPRASMTGLLMVVALVLCTCQLETTEAQTFHYSRGWTNGKRASTSGFRLFNNRPQQVASSVNRHFSNEEYPFDEINTSDDRVMEDFRNPAIGSLLFQETTCMVKLDECQRRLDDQHNKANFDALESRTSSGNIHKST
ncbi:unnamed protein product [Notodromas monacha]|uniref:Pro-corazonin n=1 Tax=Notodromas monacha TaxID=399045 RepID=A0A7R9GHI2_9CRUS|nr:unnamed protein product [Notodromas monacha]CAG0922927.1 unnamed protein product [Notodromas monacha]